MLTKLVDAKRRSIVRVHVRPNGRCEAHSHERRAQHGAKENGPLSKVPEDLHSASRILWTYGRNHVFMDVMTPCWHPGI